MSKRVLVVEDDKDFSALIEAVLLPHGYQVVVAHNCDDGFEKLHEWPPDLVTLDLQMPKGQRQSGLHFYRRIRSSDAVRDIPVVVITGVMRDDPDMRNLVKAFLEADHVAPPDAYIHKPFENEELVGTVEEVLGQSMQAR
jgi:CheY-like chemotaxis protein